GRRRGDPGAVGRPLRADGRRQRRPGRRLLADGHAPGRQQLRRGRGPGGQGVPTGILASSDVIRSAARAAVARAHRPVVSSPMSRTAVPHPVMIHQPAWLAWVNPTRSGPCSAEVTTDPTTATPRVTPIWRLVEATAAATPACARGMPATAVVVIGAFTMPNPMPRITYAAMRKPVGVVGVRPVSRRPPAMVA